MDTYINIPQSRKPSSRGPQFTIGLYDQAATHDVPRFHFQFLPRFQTPLQTSWLSNPPPRRTPTDRQRRPLRPGSGPWNRRMAPRPGPRRCHSADDEWWREETFLFFGELSSMSPGNPKWLVETRRTDCIRHRRDQAGCDVHTNEKAIQGYEVM